MCPYQKTEYKANQTVSVHMSYSKNSTLTLILTPNSGFRTIQIKRTPGSEFPMLSYSLSQAGSWQFLSHPKPTGEQTAPAQTHGTAERLGCTSPAASPEPPRSSGACLQAGAAARSPSAPGQLETRGTQAPTAACRHTKRRVTAALHRGPAEELHESSGGQNPRVDGAGGRSPDTTSSTVLLLSIKMYVFQQTCKAQLSQKFKMYGNKSSVQQCRICLLRLYALGGPIQHFF